MKRAFTITIPFLLFYVNSFAQIEHFIVIGVDGTFSPVHLTVPAGDIVTWSNQDILVHTATSGTNCEADEEWDSGDIPFEGSFSRMFNTPGTYYYFCTYHCEAGMTGVIDVTNETSVFSSSAPSFNLKAFPNPFSDFTIIEFEAERPAVADIEICDIMGNVVLKPLNAQPLSSGNQMLQINMAPLPKGIYLVKVIMDNSRVSTRRIYKK